MRTTILSVFASLLCLGTLAQNEKQNSMKLIYVYDPLCGWCYGFSPVIEEFAKNHSDEMEIEVISGGMITGDRIGPIGEVAGYISQAYKDVERSTGVEFGEGFLEGTMKEGTTIFTSIPPSKALAVFKAKYPEKALDYAAGLQKAIYYDGVAPSNIQHFAKLAEAHGYNSKDFLTEVNLPNATAMAQFDFERSSKMGISGFPTVVVEVNNKLYAIARGYSNLDQLEKQFEQLKQMVENSKAQ